MSIELTLAKAQEIIAAALSAERSSPRRAIAVAVCDAGGHPLALGREVDAPPLLAHIASAKAFTCIAYGKDSGELGAVAVDYPIWFNGISRVAASSMGLPLMGSKGGLSFRGAHGRLLGAVGVAGETGDKDEELARVGIAAAGFDQ